MERKIVAINGTIGSGKDTFSQVFIDGGFHRMSFAKTLKDAVSVIFGWDRTMLEGHTTEARLERETVDEYWSSKLGLDVTPRWVLQNFGTDVVRKHFHDNIWVFSLENHMRQIESNIIVTDCRFPNELKMLRENNATIIEVQRNTPSWYSSAYAYNVLHDMNRHIDVPEALADIHSSEWAWIGRNEPRQIVQNDSTIEDLHYAAKIIMHGILDQK